MRILGLDYGSKINVVAVSDGAYLPRRDWKSARRQSPNKLRQSLARIEEIIKEYNVERIVLGYPRMMNNTGRVSVMKQRIQRNAGASYRLYDSVG